MSASAVAWPGQPDASVRHLLAAAAPVDVTGTA